MMKKKAVACLAVGALMAAGAGVAATGFIGGVRPWDAGTVMAASPAAAAPVYRFGRPDGHASPAEFPTVDDVPHGGEPWWVYQGSAWVDGCLIDYFDDPLNRNDDDRNTWTSAAACCGDAPAGVPECPSAPG